MLRRFILAALLALAVPAYAGEVVLPVFALNIPGEGGSVWVSEIWVTNPGPVPVTVHEGRLDGYTTGEAPCLPIVVPFIVVEPYSTRPWPIGELAIGLGCPDTAAGALTFTSEGSFELGSRMVNRREPALDGEPAHGFGQEINAVELRSLPAGRLLLPGVTWHANACGATAFDTNLFVANPGETTVRVSLELQAEAGEELLVDGTRLTAPFVFTVEPHEFRRLRVAAADSPLRVCLPPVTSALLLDTGGPLAILGSVVDRSTGDARTVVPLATTSN